MDVTPVVTRDAHIDGPHGPIPVRRYAPSSAAATTSTVPIVWVHGGGFFMGGLNLPESHATALSLARAGFPVITVAYRLARFSPLRLAGKAFPKVAGVHYPVPLDDVMAVIEDVQREYPGGIILGGASAGACLVASAVLRLAASGADPVRGVFLTYGFFHASLPESSRDIVSRVKGRRRVTHAPALLDLANLHYAGSRAALLEPHAFPGGHPLEGFPTTLMVDADRDVMRASGELFASELTDEGVPVEYHVLRDESHAFLNRPNDPAFAKAMRSIVDWARPLSAATEESANEHNHAG
jgi:acetyl esterase